MGEVYQATDTKLKRKVAIKVLPEAFAANPDRVARFHREAQAVAALNHSGIAAIYDLAEAGGTTFLVLELVEGETLAQRLARGPLAVDEAVGIARQILEALGAAHEKGICHRDLKPANVALTRDGAVKVLDFGLAKFLQDRGTEGNLTDLSTTFGGTSAGVVLGTVGYMSPEQAKGLEADQRSDIFSFGCIFYELLSGRRAFEGDTPSEQLANVLKSDVDLSRLPPTLNSRLVEVLVCCLEKNPKQRWHAAADVRLLLEAIADLSSAAEDSRAAATGARPSWKWAVSVAAIALVGALAAAYGAWRLKPQPARAVTRFSIPLPEGQQFSNIGRPILALSPDGTNLVYVANRRLYVRPMSGNESRPIAGSEHTGAVLNPVFSPDGQSVAFASVGDAALKRLPISGGAPVTICKIEALFGLSWSEDGIVFGQPKGILRVSPDGGTPEVIASAAADEMVEAPQMLPGGRAVLFSVKKSADGWDKGQIVVQNLGGGARKTVIDGGAAGMYVPSGHLVYAVSTVLFAVPFNLDSLTVSGGAVSIVEGVLRGRVRAEGPTAPATAHYAYSATGSLAFIPGPSATASTEARDLALFDWKAAAQPLGLPPAPYAAPRVSPDGKWAVFERGDGSDADIWLFELSGTSAIRRLTFGGKSRAPVWAGDSQWIIFQSDRDGDGGILRQRADGSGTAERLTRPDAGAVHIPQSLSPDGAHLLFTVVKDGQSSLWMLGMKDRRASPFANVQSRLLVEAAFSPDGRWVAYQVFRPNEGRGEIADSFVQPFPPTGATYQVPVEIGSVHPVWSRNGDEIFTGIAANRDAVIPVTTSPRFGFGQPVEFAHGARLGGIVFARRNADLMPDGRILGVIYAGSQQSGNLSTPQIAVVLNWFGLRARVQ